MSQAQITCPCCKSEHKLEVVDEKLKVTSTKKSEFIKEMEKSSTKNDDDVGTTAFDKVVKWFNEQGKNDDGFKPTD